MVLKIRKIDCTLQFIVQVLRQESKDLDVLHVHMRALPFISFLEVPHDADRQVCRHFMLPQIAPRNPGLLGKILIHAS
eukprot:4581760-Amphidinium_carterae.1